MKVYDVQDLSSEEPYFEPTTAESASEAVLIRFCEDSNMTPEQARKFIKKNLPKVEIFENTVVFNDYGCKEF